jgi:two-component system cell cycle response regulator DivK
MSSKIPVMEDNEKNRILIKDVLEYHDYQVLEAENGENGVGLAKKYQPDLILMDIQMPVMDSMSAAKIIKDDPETRGIKMIALTSFAMNGDKERFLHAGFDDYIAKLIDTRKLPDVVKRYLRNGA